MNIPILWSIKCDKKLNQNEYCKQLSYHLESCKWTDFMPEKNCEEAKKKYLEVRTNPSFVEP